MPIALEQFVKQLADSGVIAPGKLEHFIPPKAAPKDAQELARQLVQSKQLTKFQAQEIYLGRAKSLILGNYTILDKIGAGGMGQVFKAEHRRMHRLVAIKMLPAAANKDAAAAARFQREVEAAAKLSHPNIVAAHDADEAGGVRFLVMEYGEGSDLSALVKKKGPLPVAKAINYILQAARGLEYAHKHSVVHRDIKPANLLLDNEGTVKILDMGLARIDAAGDTATQAELTGTGAVLGTVDYMAPEQALSTKHADARADIYSLGCSLYYLVTAHAAYDGDSLMAKLLAHREEPIPSLGAEVPAEVQAVFEKMVAKKVHDRYQTMSEVVAALEQCSSAQQTSINFQQSVDTNLDADVLTFLRDAPPHASHVQKKAKKAAPSKIAKKVARSKSGKDNRKLILGATGAGLLGLMIVAAVIFKLRTTDGTLVVEVNQPDAVVQVLDADGKVEISQPGKKGSVTLSVDPGKHRLKVEKNGFKFFAKDFEMESGGTASIKATLEPVFENATLKNPAFQKWMNDVGKLTAERQVEAVAKKLQELNPGFDGTVTPTIEKGVATKLEFVTDSVTDISPVRALAGLKALHVTGSGRGKGKLADLSSLRGMPLSSLELNDTQVSDLSPLSGMNLTMVLFTPKNITKGLGVIRQMKSLTNVGIGWGDKDQFPPDEFWKKYDAGQFGNPSTTAGTPDHKPITNINDPAFQRWMKTVAALPAEQQVEAVVKKLQELNPGFDGKVVGTDDNGTPKIENGVVTEFGVATDNLTDISPVRALVGLKTLRCAGTGGQNGILSDLHPLEGMGLTTLICGRSQMSDLSPLKGLPLTRLWCNSSNIIDLSPLRGMRFTDLRFGNTQVSNLSPLTGMPLETLYCCNTQVSDLSPLDGMKLTEIFFTPKNITRGIEAIRQIKSLTAIGNDWDSKFPPAEFWKKYDAGEFGKPASTVASPDRKPITNINDPAFKQWIKMVAALPAEKQVAAVAKKLQELNPGFDGKEEHKIEGGIVTELQFVTDYVTDISPVTALNGLKKLNCSGTGHANGENFDLSPLNGLPLTSLNLSHTRIESLSQLRGMKLAEMSCHMTHVSDLSPLRGMPLVGLDCGRTGVTDLSPLEGMQLSVLHCDATRVSSLSPLKGMPLTELRFGKTPVFDLSPLKGMPLTELYFDDTQVSDVSPLAGLQLKTCLFTPRNTIKGMDIIRQMKSLTGIGVSREEKLAPPEEFWKKYDAGEFAKPITTYNDPAFKQWEQEVAKLSAQEQIKAVVKKLQELNPEFDGNVTPQFDGQTVVGLQLSSDHVTDISPVRALRQLTSLSCATSNVYARAPLADLGPLAGMKLKSLVCYTTSVRDLSPLVGMPLEKLDCGGAFVTDLKPLRGMPLGELYLGGSTELTDLKPLAGMKLSVLSCYVTKVADLAPLAGMPLKALMFYDTPVTDLAPLERMALETAVLTPAKIRRGIGILRGMPSLHTIGIDYATRFPAVEFWKKYDAGEFGKPATAP